MRFVLLVSVLLTNICLATQSSSPEIVYFKNGSRRLGGELFKPNGKGPFPAILYNHGSAPGMLNSEASKILGPLFMARGWIFFMPYRTGQGLSSEAGAYIGDEIAKANQSGGESAAASKMLQLLAGQQLGDQMSALKWLQAQDFVKKKAIAVAGNSFGGIETILGAVHNKYCAGIDAAGAAESWAKSSELQKFLIKSVRISKVPIFFFQAENDFNLEPSKVLQREMRQANKVAEIKIYPPFGKTNRDGHSFAYLGASVWIDDAFNFIQKSCL